MSLENTKIWNKEHLQEDGMLFVRIEGISETVTKIPLIIAGLIVAAIAMPAQTTFGTNRTLELVIYADGSTHISSKIDVDPLTPDYKLGLFGPSIDNFVALGENGFLLSSEIVGDEAVIDTFGSSTITIDYDIHDLISKEGRVWTFSFDSPSDYTLLMPLNSVIVGMNALPNNMELVDEQTKLDLPSGSAEINYIFGTITQPEPTIDPPQDSFDYNTASILAGTITAAAVGISIILKKRSKPVASIPNIPTVEKPLDAKIINPEQIFKFRPEMRDDDKDIVKFISENGGQVLESDLRKKFLQPRTTMWRAVKRLERLGIVEIVKKDLQNLVILKENMEEEE